MIKTLKALLLMIVCCLTVYTAGAQNNNELYNKYTDFNLFRTQNNYRKALELGNTIIPDAAHLPEKSRISFYNGMAKVYEETNQPAKAQYYYEKVTAALPNYYVAHLALGHLYLRTVNELGVKLNASKGDRAAYDKYKSAYLAAINKTLPHLEKVQACDPYDENLALIKKLYQNSENVAGFNSLDTRLKKLSQQCLDIISER
ncbi:hypothetical protein [Mucilaginibacter sp. CSA2-8R]|uniref:hypothetical protein n=1 Tax=Mucilaginibacter sp. CSA2-8R TaxID=3141542 RepID=UPI00315DAB02